MQRSWEGLENGDFQSRKKAGEARGTRPHRAPEVPKSSDFHPLRSDKCQWLKLRKSERGGWEGSGGAGWLDFHSEVSWEQGGLKRGPGRAGARGPGSGPR